MAPAHELHQVPVPQSTEDLHFRCVLLHPLLGVPCYSLNCNIRVQFSQETSIDPTKPSLSQLLSLSKVSGRKSQFIKGKLPRSSTLLKIFVHGQVTVTTVFLISPSMSLLPRVKPNQSQPTHHNKCTNTQSHHKSRLLSLS